MKKTALVLVLSVIALVSRQAYASDGLFGCDRSDPSVTCEAYNYGISCGWCADEDQGYGDPDCDYGDPSEFYGYCTYWNLDN
jgi:hypothetical protein